MIDYPLLISKFFPNVFVHCIGDGSDFSTVQWVSGDPLPTKEELDRLSLKMHQDMVWEDIKAMRDYRKAAGVKVNGYWFHSDDTSRIQQLGLVLMGQSISPELMWKTMTGQFIKMTPTLAQQIFQAVALSDQTIFAIAEQHRFSMLESEDPHAYDYSEGWPQIY